MSRDASGALEPFLAADSFLRSYDARRRDGQLLEAVDACILQLQRDPYHPGLNTEQLFRTRDIPIYSARVNIQYRLIFAWPEAAPLTLLHLDNHDEAYDWASAARDRVHKLLKRAQEWDRRLETPRLGIPRLDEDEPIPVASIEALRQMLSGGMSRYLAVLDETQQWYATFDYRERKGLTFLKGGAGTGKTAIAIHRALWFHQQPEMGRAGVQYLCYNNALARAVSQTLNAMNGGQGPDQIRVSTFHGWSSNYLRERGLEPRQAPEHWVAGFIRKHLERLDPAELRGLEVRVIADEIGAIKRFGLQSREEYLELDRTGMGFGLRQNQRHLIWQLFELVRYEATGYADYDDYPALALRAIEEDADFPGYRAVIVDEAQDCSPVMARLAIAMVRGDDRRLMVLADPAQGIYPNGFRLARREFAPRGAQNITLRKPYRTTREVFQLAASLYRDTPETADDLKELNPPERQGPRPVIEVCSSVAEAESTLTTLVGSLLAEGREPAEIGVLVTSREQRSRVANLLGAAGLPVREVDPDPALDVPAVKTLTVHAAKGLDFPAVILFRFKAGTYLSPDEARALLYVAITRSSYSLHLITDRDSLPDLFADLDPDTFDLQGTAKGLLAR